MHIYTESIESLKKLNKGKELMESMPIKGFGTFIGIEHGAISSRAERIKITKDSILSALRCGYRHFDLAQNYSNLQAVSEAFKEVFKPVQEGGNGLGREDIWITMKGHVPSHEDMDALLEASGLIYFDLYLEHHPVPLTELEAQWRMLCQIPTAKIRHKGVSNYYQGHLQALLNICDRNGFEKPYANEIEVNIFNQEHDFVEYCQTQDIKVIAYSPLAYNMSGFLPDFSEEISDLHCTNKQLILSWLISRGITVIPSSRNPEHQMENYEIDHLIGAFANPELLSKINSYETGDAVTQTASDFKEASTRLMRTAHSPGRGSV
jgi:methylglyoxal/glyoxal reductase